MFSENRDHFPRLLPCVLSNNFFDGIGEKHAELSVESLNIRPESSPQNQTN